jgi:hypothetical protein
MRAYRPLQMLLSRDQTVRARLSARVDLDLSEDINLAGALIGAALHYNRGGILLVGSRVPRRVREFGTILQNAKWRKYGAELMAALAAEDHFPAPI